MVPRNLDFYTESMVPWWPDAPCIPQYSSLPSYVNCHYSSNLSFAQDPREEALAVLFYKNAPLVGGGALYTRMACDKCGQIPAGKEEGT
jgi:hypothetical protein